MAEAVRTRTWTDETTPALKQLIEQTSGEVSPYGSVADVPANIVTNTRNDMYLIGEALKLIDSKKLLPVSRSRIWKTVKAYHAAADNTTKFIPTWVKVAVALALGLGTMVGWKAHCHHLSAKRSGKTHLAYGQGAAAEITVAAATIGAADYMGACRCRPPMYSLLPAQCRRHDGGQRLRAADVDGAQFGAGVGPHSTGRNGAILPALRAAPPVDFKRIEFKLCG